MRTLSHAPATKVCPAGQGEFEAQKNFANSEKVALSEAADRGCTPPSDTEVVVALPGAPAARPLVAPVESHCTGRRSTLGIPSEGMVVMASRTAMTCEAL